MAQLSLYTIGENMRELDEALSAIDGEVTDEFVEKMFDDWFEKNKDDLENKLEDYGHVIKNRQATAALRHAKATEFQKEADRLKALANADDNQVERMKRRVCLFFAEHEIKSIETETFKFRRQGNGGKTPMILAEDVLDNARILPVWAVEERPVAKKDLMYEVLTGKNNEYSADDLEDLVWLGEKGEHVQVK